MWRYGFELEGFWCSNETNNPILPATGVSTDGFPGLVEVRTSGGQELYTAYLQLMGEVIRLRNFKGGYAEFHRHTSWKFTPEERRELRKRPWDKAPVDVQNIYGKKPRDLGKLVIASLQINISLLRKESYLHHISVEGKSTSIQMPAIYDMPDIPLIIKRLDEAFIDEIKASNRQSGEYCIKDNIRLEYRSLPCSSFRSQLSDVAGFLNKIKQAVER